MSKKFDLVENMSQRESFEALAAKELQEYIEPDNLIDTSEDSQIASFYDCRSVFITGASGFVGKCLLEKLLRSCPKIKRVYILMRSKRGVCVQDRVSQLIQSKLFDRLRQTANGRESLTSKIQVVEGDITKPNFGLTDENIEELSSQVSILFHSAATVKFEEALKLAVENNVISVENLIGFAAKLKNLKILVHVSTAYSNCDREQVDEQFYKTPIQADKLIKMSNWMDPDTFENISPALLGRRPNSYTYTKAVAESLLVEKSKLFLPHLPIVMIRPSIVGGAWKQPIRGWVDNFNGPTGVILAMMSGALQGMHVRPDYCADLVPVDVVANLIICSPWKILNSDNNNIFKDSSENELLLSENFKDHPTNITIFNCVSSSLNPLKWKDLHANIYPLAKIYPINDSMRPAGSALLSNEHIFKVYNYINHTCIAYLGDFFIKLSGKKSKLVPLHNRMMKMIKTLRPFTTNQWLFNCSNTTKLYDSLSTVDKDIFNFDIRQVNWSDYLPRYYIGAKLFVVKDDLGKLWKTRERVGQVDVCSKVARTLMIVLAYYTLILGSDIETLIVQLFRQCFDYFKMII